MKLYKVDADGVFYYVAANNDTEASEIVERHEEFECGEKADSYISKEITEDVKISYEDEDLPDTTAFELMDGLTKSEILACSEW